MTFEQIERSLKNYCIGIAGAGGLGSNCAVALARSGIGKLIIADFDRVSESNLNRQYYSLDQIGEKKVEALKANIQGINPRVEVEIFDLKIDIHNIVSVFGMCDILVEAFDQANEKQMLIETFMYNFPERPIIAGSGMAGYGKSDKIKIRQAGQLYICGDGFSEISETLPPLAPRVGIVAHMQANQVLEIILDKLIRPITS
jgi:sulfur carrier protein ThiS adenylyltransferase